MTSRRFRKRVKAAILRSRIPFKAQLATLYLRSKERYLTLRAGRDEQTDGNGVAVPPARLRVLVAGSPDLANFLQTGETHASYLRQLLADAGRPVETLDAMLDFGCGCGRIARWFRDAPAQALHGCDYNDELVRWCAEHLQFMRAQTNELAPPLPYPEASFDFVYAFSVFTHLSFELADAWMRELERVVKPGGLIWFTLHGESYRDRLSRDEQQRFDRGEIVVWLPEIEGTNMCGAYWPETSVTRVLGERFEVLTHFNPRIEAATAERIQLAHDAYLARRR